MRAGLWVGVVGLALATFGLGGAAAYAQPGEDDREGPRPQRVQLFISPSGQPFRVPTGQPYPVADWFAQADRDHDGKLTREEFRADAEAFFKMLDANGDGQISMPEVTRWEEQIVPEITRIAMLEPGRIPAERGDMGRHAVGRNELNTRMQGAAAWSLINEPHPIRGADADFSLSVSRAEWRAAADRRFALLDKDEKGAITLADLPPTPVQVFEEREAKKGGKGGGRGRPPR